MDPRPPRDADDPLIVTGLGHALRNGGGCDPLPHLRTPKLRKYMGVQDDLAVVAAANALQSAGLLERPLGERTGLYLVVGHIPFEETDLDGLLRASLEEGRFSMDRFSTAGIRAVNGLLTFRCLPNMPAFHISVNFDIQGPYFVTYPGPGQFYLALEQSCWALQSGTIDVALVGGVAHQRNLLVESHFRRLVPPVEPDRLCDAAGCLVLERSDSPRNAVARGALGHFQIGCRPHDPLATSLPPEEQFLGCGAPDGLPPGDCPASLPLALSLHRGEGTFEHHLQTRDGITASSRWRLA